MDVILSILALLGIGAAALHALRAAFRFLRSEADGVWTDAVARTHARRGDVTQLEEARDRGRELVRNRRMALVMAIGWLVLLIVPPLTPWARSIFAAYALLWILPLVRRRPV